MATSGSVENKSMVNGIDVRGARYIHVKRDFFVSLIKKRSIFTRTLGTRLVAT